MRLSRFTRRVLALSAVGMFTVLSVAVADDSNSQKLVLNAYSPASTGMAGPVTTSDALTSGRLYEVIVRGTYSAYAEELMDGKGGYKVCGEPVRAPRNSGVQGEEGQDAEFVFAKPLPTHRFCPNLPFVHPNFVISTTGPSGPFVHIDPVGGVPTAVNPHHKYIYNITGTGQPASFAILDSNTTDNYGQLNIRVHACKSTCSSEDAADLAAP